MEEPLTQYVQFLKVVVSHVSVSLRKHPQNGHLPAYLELNPGPVNAAA